MTDFSRSHLTDGALLVQAHTDYTNHRHATAALLADLAEIEARQLHIASGYSSMREWCVGELKMSDDAISDRLQAARTARQYPAIFGMMADGRLHLTAVLLLSKHLTRGNAAELLAGASRKTKAEIAEWLAGRFPSTEALPMVMAAPAASLAGAHSTVPERSNTPIRDPRPDRVAGPAASFAGAHSTVPERSNVPMRDPRPDRVAGPAASFPGAHSTVPERSNAHLSERPADPVTGPVAVPTASVQPVASGRHLFQFMGDDVQRQLLREVQDLLGPQVPGGDIGAVFFRGLEVLKRQLEKRKFAATDRPHGAHRRRQDSRRIPAHVRREVWKRDGGRCAFVGENRHRCGCRRGLEYDHILPVARGGASSVSNVRLLCRVHNQFEAERVYGRDFMEAKREEARVQGETGRARVEARCPAEGDDARSGAEAMGPPSHAVPAGADAEALGPQADTSARADGEPAPQAEAEVAARAHAEDVAKTCDAARPQAEALAHAEASAHAEATAPAQAEALALAEATAHAEATARARPEALALAEATARAEAEALAHAEATARAEAEALAQAEAQDQLLDVIAGLRWLGFRTERARWAAEKARRPGATIEEHIKDALRLLCPKRTQSPPVVRPAAVPAAITPSRPAAEEASEATVSAA